MKTRPCNWITPQTREVSYGIEVFFQGQWMYAAENNAALLFTNEEKRDNKQNELERLEISGE